MLERVRDKLLSVLYPEGLACACCGREAVTDEHGLCEECSGGLELYVASPLIKNVDGFTAALVYNDVSGGMVKQLKYNGRRFIAPVLAGFIELPGELDIDAVVPVPLYKKRLRERGFNQSELIAAALCKRYGLRLDNGLIERAHDTDTQTHRTAASRRTALKKAFVADDACRGLSVLLVDDVRTTGATLSECAAELKRHGCKTVYAAAVCFSKDK